MDARGVPITEESLLTVHIFVNLLAKSLDIGRGRDRLRQCRF